MSLLFEATTAYLGPLMKKHDAGEAVVWEDLVSSHAACSAVLRHPNSPFLLDRMDKLHQSQVKAYRETAIYSIKEWASSLSLQPMEERDTKETFVNRCVSAGTTVPNWQLPNAKAVAITEIRRRADAAYEKYHPAEENMKEEVTDETEDSTDEISEDEIKQPVKYTHPNIHKRKGDINNPKNVSVRKKVASVKGGYRNKGGGNRGGRRGGRGGRGGNNNSN